jgi:hypothetical protein
LNKPTLAGVKVTAQVAVAPLPERLHVAEEKLPALPAENVTVPDGVIGVPELVSVTVVMHVELEPAATLAGEQETEVVVDSRTAMLKSMSPYAVV